MHEFDLWLIERLTLAGCLIFGDPAPDVPSGISLFQQSIGLPVCGWADDLTVHYLRQQTSRFPDAAHVFFLPVPARAGSLYARPMEIAA